MADYPVPRVRHRRGSGRDGELSRAADIADKLERRKLEVLRYLLPEGRVVGHEFVVGSLKGEKGRSLKVSLNGKGTVWSDFATGESGGDLLDLWAAVRCGRDLGDAIREVAEWLAVEQQQGDPAKRHDCQKEAPGTGGAAGTEASGQCVMPVTEGAPPRPVRADDDIVWVCHRCGWSGGWRGRKPLPASPTQRTASPKPTGNQRRALEIWRNAVPSIKGTPVETYLRSRGIDPARLLTDPPGWSETLRWTEDADMLPRSTKRAAMICAVNSRHHHMVIAIHRHFLNSDGTPVLNANGKKLKLSLGPVDGNAIELSAWPSADGRWGLAEGVETALCVEAAFRMPCYAAISAGNLSKVKPPTWASDAAIFADNDESETGIREAGKALAAFRAMPQFGGRVRVLMADAVGLDFADLVGSRHG